MDRGPGRRLDHILRRSSTGRLMNEGVGVMVDMAELRCNGMYL